MMKQKFILDINPATGEIFEKIKCSSSSEIASGVKLAKKAFKTWKDVPLKNKIVAFRKILKDFIREKEEIAKTISLEMGKIHKDSIEEVEYVIDSLQRNIDLVTEALEPEIIKSKNITTEIIQEAIGVTAVISTWAQPILIPESLLTPAILTGNTVVFKPSEHTPLCGKIMYEIYNRYLPKGVINLLQGAEEVALTLLNADIDMIAFTGTKEIGKQIMSSASKNLNRIILGLGGKDAMLVTKDANIDKAASFAVQSSLKNAGQNCSAVERIYVEDKIFKKFEQSVLKEIKKFKVSTNGSDKGDLSPMIDDEHRNFVIRQIEEANRKGAKLLYGGNKLNGKGYFLEPTLISELTEKHEIMNDETNGPVICLQKVRSVDEAIAKINDSSFGLGATIWSTKYEKALDIATKIDAGMIGINNSVMGLAGTPWVGRKESGYGYIGSKEGFKNFTQIKKITYNK